MLAAGRGACVLTQQTTYMQESRRGCPSYNACTQYPNRTSIPYAEHPSVLTILLPLPTLPQLPHAACGRAALFLLPPLIVTASGI